MYARAHSQRKRSVVAAAVSSSRYILRVPSLPPLPRPPAPAPASPPFGLASPVFPFPALARLAGLAQLGGSRETVLAILLGARLAMASMPPYHLSADERTARARSALAWLDAISLPPGIRPAVAAVLAASGEGRPETIANAIERLRTDARDALDEPSNAELGQLVSALRQDAATDDESSSRGARGTGTDTPQQPT